MIISDSEKKEYEKSNICHICEKKIDMTFKDIQNKNDCLIATSDAKLEKVFHCIFTSKYFWFKFILIKY